MIKNQSEKFSLSTEQIYLNCAYMSPILKSVEQAGIDGIRRKGNPADISPADFFSMADCLRQEFASLINIQDPNNIAIIPSVSYGMANVVNNIKLSKGDQVIVTGEQFPSNYYPWKTLAAENGGELCVVSPPNELDSRGRKWNERLLEAITRDTKVVALAHVHWTDGTLFDLKALRLRTREVGALLIIDGTQSVGALPFDAADIQPDALVCAGYKWLLGPYALGLAYYSESFDEGKPIEENWINRLNSENFTELVNYREEYQPGALRYEVGEHSNFILVPMLLTALKQINQWGPENIQHYCDDITKDALEKLSGSHYHIEEERFRARHLFGIRSTTHLKREYLLELLSKEKIFISVRGNSIRVSPHVYNTAEEMQKLVDLLLKL